MAEDQLDGFAGLMLPSGDLFGILVNESDQLVRRRFTVAHELGHFCIPSHKHCAVRCISPESADTGSPEAEQEANAFAAELLSPRRLVAPMVGTGQLDIEKADKIADAFQVSRLSAALRACEVSRDGAAVVYVKANKIVWTRRFGFPYGLPPIGASPRGDTVAYELIAGTGEGSKRAKIVPSDAWLPYANGRVHGDILESSVRGWEHDSVLTLLWLAP